MRPEYEYCFFKSENQIKNSLAYKWATSGYEKEVELPSLANSIDKHFSFSQCRKNFNIGLDDYCSDIWSGRDVDKAALRKGLIKILTISGIFFKPKIEDNPEYSDLFI